MRIIIMRTMLAGLAALAVISAGGCGQDPSRAGGRLAVVASFYPLAFAAGQIGGDHVNVRNLVKPGTEPHDLDLTPRQVGAVADADLVLYLRGLQPIVDQSVESEAHGTSFDAASVQPLRGGFVPLERGESHEDPSRGDQKGKDPHVWLDPVRYAAISDAIGARLAKVDPAHAADYTANARVLHRKLAALDADYAAGLKNCQHRTFVTSHNAFGYLASRYGLDQRSISGLNPDAEPSPRRLAELADYVHTQGISVVFFESLVSPKLAQTLADETGAHARVLDPIEGVKPGGRSDYLSLMHSNLAALRAALGCS
jgi:zinc transport system substrate-binding protein